MLPKQQRDKLPDNSTDIFCTNIIDRPLELEGISLFKFASWYKLSSSDTMENSYRCSPRMKLMSLNKIMQKRRKLAIIKTPKCQGNSEQYYYTLLMLPLPFRNETKLMDPYSSAQQAFTEKNHLFDLSDIQFEVFLNDIKRTVRLLRSTRDEIGAIVAPNTHANTQYSEEISLDHAFINADDMETDEYTNQDFCNQNKGTLFHSLHVYLLSPEELENEINI